MLFKGVQNGVDFNSARKSTSQPPAKGNRTQWQDKRRQSRQPRPFPLRSGGEIQVLTHDDQTRIGQTNLTGLLTVFEVHSLPDVELSSPAEKKPPQ